MLNVVFVPQTQNRGHLGERQVTPARGAFNARLVSALLGLLLGTISPAAAAEIEIKIIEQAPPAEIAESLRAKLTGRALQLTADGSSIFTFWFAEELILKTKPESPVDALRAVKPISLMGAVAVPSDRRDYKDDELYAGTYTMRFGLQPQDGNHLGTSEFPFFALLTPAKIDRDSAGFPTEKSLQKASARETATDHPVILSLRPHAVADPANLPKLTKPLPDHQAVVVRVPAKIEASGEKTQVMFELVYSGKGKK